MKRIKEAALAAILLFATFLNLAFFYGPSGINGSDNYVYANSAHDFLTKGFSSFIGGNLNVKYAMTIGIALFYALLGYSVLSSVVFDLLSFLMTIIIIYLIGKELYNENAGLVSAFLYSFLPMAVILSASVGDDVPMAFLASLSVLLLLLAFKRKRHQELYCLLSGFITIVGFTIAVEELIILPLLVLLFVYFKVLKRKSRYAAVKNFAVFFLGILLGVASIMSISYISVGNPLYVFRVNDEVFSSWTVQPNYSFIAYLDQLLPYNVLSHLSAPNGMQLNNLLTLYLSAGERYQSYFIGFYFYLALLFALYSVLRLDRRFLVPELWVITTLLYLGFGTMSIERYTFIPVLQRFTMIFCPALALVIGFGVYRLFEDVRSKTKRLKTRFRSVLPYILPLIVIGFMLSQSICAIMYMSYTEYHSLYAVIRIAEFVRGLPQNAHILVPINVPLPIYAGYPSNFYGLTPPPTCSDIMSDYYVVTDYNKTLQMNCGLVVAFNATMPAYLLKYNATLGGPGFDFSSLVVYHKST